MPHPFAPGPTNSMHDIDGLAVGQAEDRTLRSGVSVVLGDEPFIAGVHVMGGAPGTRETDLLAADKTVEAVDALVLSGGSAFGLAAADGVMGWLKAAGRGFPVGPHRVPIVPGAIVFDLMGGGDHGWRDNPYPALGRSATAAAGAPIREGNHGAGTGAMTAGLKGGVGTASARLPSGHLVAALVVVNALGSVVVPGTRRFWAAGYEEGAEFGGLGVATTVPRGLAPTKMTAGRNTTIAVVATDAVISQAQATRMAVAAHDGMARAIVPSHTPMDGDLVFAAATGRNKTPLDAEGLMWLGHGAAVALARAIARGVYHARPAPGDPLPCWNELSD